MDVLLLGGTGVIGDSLKDKLCGQKGYNIYITSRKRRENKPNLHYICGNAMDDVFLREVVATHRWDCIVDFMSYSTIQFRKRIDLLLDATEQYVYISSARVYDFDQNNIDENSKLLLDTTNNRFFLRHSDYALDKGRQEQILKRSGKNNWSIVRPYKTFSDSRLQLGCFEKEDWLFYCISHKTIIFSKDIESKVTNLSYAGDVADSILEIVGNHSFLGKTKLVVTGVNISWKKVLDMYVSSIEANLKQPINVVYGRNAYDICRGTPDNTIKYDTLKNHFFCGKEGNPELEWKLEVRIKECINSFLKNGDYKKIDWVLQARFDTISSNKTSLYDIPSLSKKIVYFLIRYLGGWNVFVLMRKIKYVLKK